MMHRTATNATYITSRDNEFKHEMYVDRCISQIQMHLFMMTMSVEVLIQLTFAPGFAPRFDGRHLRVVQEFLHQN